MPAVVEMTAVDFCRFIMVNPLGKKSSKSMEESSSSESDKLMTAGFVLVALTGLAASATFLRAAPFAESSSADVSTSITRLLRLCWMAVVLIVAIVRSETYLVIQ